MEDLKTQAQQYLADFAAHRNAEGAREPFADCDRKLYLTHECCDKHRALSTSFDLLEGRAKALLRKLPDLETESLLSDHGLMMLAEHFELELPAGALQINRRPALR
jgi:hypothetical protein